MLKLRAARKFHGLACRCQRLAELLNSRLDAGCDTRHLNRFRNLEGKKVMGRGLLRFNMLLSRH
jgi:hypothetical protein